MFNANDGQFSKRGEMAGRDAPVSALDVIGELSERMKKLEAEHAELKAIVNDARERGAVGFDLEHASHVLNKHFFHDRPAPEAIAAPIPKFDAFTGQPLN